MRLPGDPGPLSPSLAGPLRDALLAADFTYDGRLGTLVRLFLLQRAVPRVEAERALPGLVDRLAAAGMLARSAGEVRARLDCRP